MQNRRTRRNLSGADTNYLFSPERKPVGRVPVSAPTSRVPMQRVREAALRAVTETSPRSLARAVGMSAPGLQHFLDGGEPQKATARKLVEWYVRDAASGRGLDESTATAVLSLLKERMPAAEAEATRGRVLAELREGYKRSGTPPPAWLKG